MALPIKPSVPSRQAGSVVSTPDVATALLPGAPRSSGRASNPAYPKLLGGQVSEAMYATVKAEVARRVEAGEPPHTASIGAIIREAIANHLGIPQ